MDEIIKALLAGATDQEILEMLDRLGEERNRDDGQTEPDYVSCVKVGGASILPPVMTEERRLECLKWRRKALEVDEKIGNKRREVLANNIQRIVSGVIDRNNPATDGLEVYSILRSNSRTADVVLNNFTEDSELTTNIESQSVENISPSFEEDDISQSEGNTKSKTFEEIKKLVKTLPNTPRSARFQTKVLSSGPSSDISDDDDTTTASSLRTEANDDDLFSLRSLTRHKQSPEQSNIYDSMLSVDTVIENVNYKNDDLELEPRPRRGSYSLSKPSPVLVAYMQKIGKPDDVLDEKCSVSPVEQSVKWKPKTKSTIPPSTNVVTTRPDVTKHRDEFLAGFTKCPSIPRASKPAVGDEEKETAAELRLELGSVVSTTESCQTTGSETYRTGTTITPSLPLPAPGELSSLPASVPEASAGIPETLKLAVTRLAQQQEQSLEELIKQQETARLRLREEFQKQQQELMAEILSQFPRLLENNITTSEEGPGKMEEVELELERSIKEISRENSFLSESSVSLGEYEGEDKENIPTKTNLARKGTFTKRDKVRVPAVVVKIPEEAFLHQRAWVRLTALARGHLTRLLLRTEKVGDIKRTIKETVACAVNLHLESGATPPSREDLQLHSRLLAQIESACQSLHHIFFELSTAERMNLLALNRVARQRMSTSRPSQGQAEGKKKISAATAARLKTKNSPKVETFDDKRQRVLKNARHISLQTGKVLSNHKTMTTRSKSSPRIHLRKSKPILSTKIRQSPILNFDSPYFKREKPVWK